MMRNQNWKETKKLFHAALELTPAEREEFLSANCQDAELRREVEELLAFHEKDNEFINKSGEIDIDSISDEVNFIGEQVGNYKILREVGRGGMGVVYEALRDDGEFQQKAAVKIIKRGMDTDFILRRFRNERQILATLNHPFIARLLDGGTTNDNLPYLVMEYIEGEPLLKFCDTHNFDIPERLNLFLQVCTAVSYAHQNLIVHRDIKPSNIFVSADGNPKLLDFGIAKIINPAPGAGETTDGFARLFTPDYASPEQIRGEHITTVSDVYSLGVVLYELLSGQHPFRKKKNLAPHEWMKEICETEPERPSSVVCRPLSVEENQTSENERQRTKDKERGTNPKSQIPNPKSLKGDLDRIILKALQKQPDRRYISVDQFAEDIRRHLKGLPVIAQTDSVSYRLQKFVKRHRIGVLATGLIFLSLLIGISAAAWQAHRANLERAKAVERFNQVRKLANTVLFEYHDSVAKLAGSTTLREKMVKDSLEYLDNLSGENTDDSELQNELAAAYEKVGDVQGNPFNGNEGDQNAALASYQKAMAIREKLFATNPRDIEIQRKLAANCNNVGDILFIKAANEEAIKTYQRGLQLYEQLTTDDPSDLQDRFAGLSIQDRIGRVQQQSGDLTNALATFRKILSQVESMEAADPTNFKFRRGIAISQTTVGDILRLTHDYQAALDLHKKAASRLEELSNEDQSNIDIKRNLALLYIRIADEQRELKDIDNCIKNNYLAISILKKLEDDPQNVQNSYQLADVYGNLGQALGEKGEIKAAEENIRIALKLFEDLLRRSPEFVMGRSDFGNTYIMLAEILEKKGDLDSALENYRKALTILEVEPMRSMDDPDRLAKAYEEMGDLELRQAERNKKADYLNSAKNLYQQSADAWNELQKQNKLSADETNRPLEIQQKLSQFEAKLK